MIRRGKNVKLTVAGGDGPVKKLNQAHGNARVVGVTVGVNQRHFANLDECRSAPVLDNRREFRSTRDKRQCQLCAGGPYVGMA